MASDADSLPLKVGDVLDGKYSIERTLGQGGMAAVFAARHEKLGEEVAIKVLLPNFAKNEEVVGRFEREARAVAKIKSHHVVRVFDVGVLPDGAPYLVMELLHGEDLAARLTKLTKLPWRDAVYDVLDACEAIAEAHEAGIIHRDLKPSNLFVVTNAASSRRSPVKVLDFGISKVANVDRLSTDFKSTMGTPYYMAPEQMRSSKNADARSDIWSLGVILYELTSGALPFEGTEMTEVVMAVAQNTPKPLGEISPDLPSELVSIVGRCLMKDPAERFQTIRELRSALEALVNEVPASPREPSAPSLPIATAPTVMTPSQVARAEKGGTEIASTNGNFGASKAKEPIVEPAPPNRTTLVVGALAVIAVVSVGGYALSRNQATIPAAPIASTSAAAPEPSASATVAVEPAPTPQPMAETPPLVSASATASASATPKKPDAPKRDCSYVHLLSLDTPQTETVACLRPKLQNGTASSGELSMLKSACTSVGDKACVDQVKAAQTKSAQPKGPDIVQ